MKEITIRVPEEVYNSMIELQYYYGAANLANLLSLGADVLKWAKNQYESDAQVCALSLEDNTVMASGFPTARVNCDMKKMQEILKHYKQQG